MTAMTMSENLAPGRIEIVPGRPLRIGLVGASHWHAPFYTRALRQLGSAMVGLTDANSVDASRRSQELEIMAYASPAVLKEKAQPDFIYAFAPHCDMTNLVWELIACGTPFVIEKPTGLKWQPLAEAAAEARRRSVWAGVDLPARTQRLVGHLRELRHNGTLGKVINFRYRLFAGDPQRYTAWGVPWMLDPNLAGAGCLYNFGPHVVDAFQWLTGEPVAEVRCHLSYMHGLAVPDYAQLTCVGAGGAVGTLEVGYICPDDFYDRDLTLGSDGLYVSSQSLDTGTLRWRDGRAEEVTMSDVGSDFWLGYVREVERRWRAGEPPVATLEDMAHVLRVLNAAEESASTGLAVHLEWGDAAKASA